LISDDELLSSIASEPYEARGIIHSEMGLIIQICRRLGIEVIIESGRARGQSTYMLAKYLPDVAVHSVELRDHPDEMIARDRLAEFKNVHLISGDGAELLPNLAGMTRNKTAILCDGPKGRAAVDIIDQCFQHDHVLVGFIHDMRKLDHGLPSPHRAAAVSQFKHHAFSDEERLVTSSSWMDANVIAAGGPCGPAHQEEFGSYGPTVGVFLNKH
jgi:hypothetical protein